MCSCTGGGCAHMCMHTDCSCARYFIIDMHGHNYAADDDAAHMHVFDIYKLSQAWKLVVTLVLNAWHLQSQDQREKDATYQQIYLKLRRLSALQSQPKHPYNSPLGLFSPLTWIMP